MTEIKCSFDMGKQTLLLSTVPFISLNIFSFSFEKIEKLISKTIEPRQAVVLCNLILITIKLYLRKNKCDD